MTLYSYIVTQDGGFAPNPFFGYCTLACCKPGIRKHAKEGDWVVGLTPKADGNRIIYYMQVDESIGFSEYWKRFRRKQPNPKGGLKQKVGDNIYQPNGHGGYRQLPSAHSKPQFDEGEDPETKKRDLGGERVLVSTTFAYFGSKPLKLPKELKELKIGRSYRCNFSDEVKEAFRHFVSEQREFGLIAAPGLWKKDDGSWKRSGCGRV